MAEKFNIYATTLIEPVKMKAGTWGDSATPIYFSCCRCMEKDPEIAGFFSLVPDPQGKPITDVACVLQEEEGPFLRLALYCKKCWPEVRAVGPGKGATDVNRAG